MTTIKLNETNCTEMNADEFEAKAKQANIDSDYNEIKKVEKQSNKTEYKSDEFYKLCSDATDMKKAFVAKYDMETLTACICGKRSSFAKLSNSKGNGYGNM